MKQDRCTVVFSWHKRGEEFDIDIPLDISANELIVGLNEALGLQMNTANLTACHLKAENPIALLRGSKLLRDYGLHEGSVIHYTQ